MFLMAPFLMPHVCGMFAQIIRGAFKHPRSLLLIPHPASLRQCCHCVNLAPEKEQQTACTVSFYQRPPLLYEHEFTLPITVCVETVRYCTVQYSTMCGEKNVT